MIAFRTKSLSACTRPACAARASISSAFLTLDQREAEVRRSMARLRELGWHARLHVNGDDLLENSDLLRSLKDMPMVIDHFGHVGFEGGMDRPVIRWVLDMLQAGELVDDGVQRQPRFENGRGLGRRAFPMAKHSSKRRPTASSGAPTGRIRSGPSA